MIFAEKNAPKRFEIFAKYVIIIIVYFTAEIQRILTEIFYERKGK